MTLTAHEVIEALGLTPLPTEGGHLRQTYLDERCCAIYYLMAQPDFSGLHRLEHLEIWAHHAGAPARMLLIDPAGVVTEPVLGSDLAAGQVPQVIVPPGVWMAAEPLGDWSLLSTFMAPPYADDIVTFARWADLDGRFDGRFLEHAERIRRLCRF